MRRARFLFLLSLSFIAIGTYVRRWLTSSLLITVVRDEVGEGHAVRTMQGDFILEGRRGEDMEPYPYAYVTRQSYLDTMIWMSLDPHESSSTPPIAGARSEPGR
jgi:Bacterial transglutaminase-like cysteine proteinase BTLCP